MLMVNATFPAIVIQIIRFYTQHGILYLKWGQRTAFVPRGRTETRTLLNKNNSNRFEGYQAKTKRQIPLVILSPV